MDAKTGVGWLYELGQDSIEKDTDYVVLAVIRKGNISATAVAIEPREDSLFMFNDDFTERYYFPMRAVVTENLVRNK